MTMQMCTPVEEVAWLNYEPFPPVPFFLTQSATLRKALLDVRFLCSRRFQQV